MLQRSRAARWISAGPHPVARTEVAAWAAADGRDVAVLARYPADGASRGPLPVVVLCHGVGGDQHGYAALSLHLASHGYAVLHPQFLDSLPLARRQLRLPPVTGMTWAADPRARSAMLGLLFDPAHWISRLRRVHAVLGSLAGQPHLPVRLRADRVIAAGHSFGAYTAQLLLGTTLHGVGLDGEKLAHPAVHGGILLSPQGSGDRGLTRHSWARVTAPLLVLTGTADLGPHGEGLDWRCEPYQASPARYKHLAVVRGGDHHLGGIELPEADTGTAPGGAVRRALSVVATAFADAVHDDLPARRWLGTGPYPDIFRHEHQETAA